MLVHCTEKKPIFHIICKVKQKNQQLSHLKDLLKVFAEKLNNGKTVENDRRNDCNVLILVLKDT